MPSRRRFLAAATGLPAVASTGCLTALGAAETGFLSYKAVHVEWEHRGRRSGADLCWLWSDGRGRLFGWVAAGYEEIAADPLRVHVVDVSRGAQGDPRAWEREIGTMDFEELYGDRGAPSTDRDEWGGTVPDVRGSASRRRRDDRTEERPLVAPPQPWVCE